MANGYCCVRYRWRLWVLRRSCLGSNKFPKQALAKLRSTPKLTATSSKDAASHILKALALDLMWHKSSAIKLLDSTLSSLASRTLSERERGDMLFRRTEMQVAVNRRRRVESAVGDLMGHKSPAINLFFQLCRQIQTH